MLLFSKHLYTGYSVHFTYSVCFIFYIFDTLRILEFVILLLLLLLVVVLVWFYRIILALQGSSRERGWTDISWCILLMFCYCTLCQFGWISLHTHSCPAQLHAVDIVPRESSLKQGFFFVIKYYCF